MYGYAGSSAAASAVAPFKSPPETTNAAGAASQGDAVAQAAGTSSSAGTQSALSQVISSVPNTLQGLASPMSASGVSPFAPGSNTATTGIAGFLNMLDGQTGSSIGSFLASGLSNGVLSGNWLNPASISPAVTTAFGDIGFLAVAGQAGSGLNPALLMGSTAAPSAIGAAGLSHAGSAIGSSGLGGSAVSAGVGRATLVGTVSVPPSWTAAVPATSQAATATAAEGWYNPPGIEEASARPGVPGMPGMPMGGGAGGRGWGFAAPRYGFKPTVVAHPPAAG